MSIPKWRRLLPASRRLLWLRTYLNPQTVPMMEPAQYPWTWRDTDYLDGLLRVAVGRAKAKAKAKPTSAPAVAPTGGARVHPQDDLHTKDQFQSTRCRSLSPRALPRRNPLTHHWIRNVLSALILYDKVAVHIPSRKLAVIVAIQVLKEEKTSQNIHSRTALTNK